MNKIGVGIYQPGPWIVETNAKSEYYQVQTKPGLTPRGLVATCGYKGDAYLIAAAPDLLDMLKQVQHIWSEWETYCPDIAKVIAKAEGKQP